MRGGYKHWEQESAERDARNAQKSSASYKAKYLGLRKVLREMLKQNIKDGIPVSDELKKTAGIK